MSAKLGEDCLSFFPLSSQTLAYFQVYRKRLTSGLELQFAQKKKMLRFFFVDWNWFQCFLTPHKIFFFLAMMQQSVKRVGQFKLWRLWFWAHLKMCVCGHAGELCGCDGVFQSFRSCPQPDTQWLKGLGQIVGLLEAMSWLNTTLVMWGSHPQTAALLSVTTLSSLSQIPQYAELTSVF